MRTRFAPSPTGFLHIGGLRTALYAYAMAKHVGGEFLLRIEDTDQKREVEGSTEALQVTLKKFGLVWDELHIQSERHKSGIYKNAAEKLVKDGNAFYCQCKPKNAKEQGFSVELRDPCRDLNLTTGAIKLRVPDGEIVKYTDFVHKKEISWNTDTVYDATLLKSDGFPTYHLAAMTDDVDMKITHIIRGHDWMPSTPIHLLVFKYLGAEIPEIGHPTDILSAETGKKLSKRRDSVFCEQFLEEGYLPEALLNFIFLLGWAPKDNRELYTLDEMVKSFDSNGFQDANPRFFREKLDWFNGQYIRKLSVDNLLEKLGIDNNQKNKSIVALIQDRLEKLSDFKVLTKFFYEQPEVDTSLFGENYKEHLVKAIEGIKNDRDLMEVVKENNFKTGDFFMSLRIALTGMKFTPPINESIVILGKEETIERLKELI
jgi:glutamyl-tRNA synthetase